MRRVWAGGRARAAMCSPWRGHVEGKKDKGERLADGRRVTFLPGPRRLPGSVQSLPLRHPPVLPESGRSGGVGGGRSHRHREHCRDSECCSWWC